MEYPGRPGIILTESRAEGLADADRVSGRGIAGRPFDGVFAMKKLASLLALCAIGLFAAGCNKADDGPAPTPDTAPSVEGGSGGPAADHPETGTSETPPTTNETPPTTTETPPTAPPAGENADNKPANENKGGDNATPPAGDNAANPPAEGENTAAKASDDASKASGDQNKPAEGDNKPAEGGNNPQ